MWLSYLKPLYLFFPLLKQMYLNTTYNRLGGKGCLQDKPCSGITGSFHLSELYRTSAVEKNRLVMIRAVASFPN